jgi:hypothetical protein
MLIVASRRPCTSMYTLTGNALALHYLIQDARVARRAFLIGEVCASSTSPVASSIAPINASSSKQAIVYNVIFRERIASTGTRHTVVLHGSEVLGSQQVVPGLARPAWLRGP